jgi:hypothetical protein
MHTEAFFSGLLLYTSYTTMSHLVTSTADILAILGGVTTLVGAIFAAVRLSRCQTVTCCWGAFTLVNKPLPPAPANRNDVSVVAAATGPERAPFAREGSVDRGPDEIAVQA